MKTKVDMEYFAALKGLYEVVKVWLPDVEREVSRCAVSQIKGAAHRVQAAKTHAELRAKGVKSKPCTTCGCMVELSALYCPECPASNGVVSPDRTTMVCKECRGRGVVSQATTTDKVYERDEPCPECGGRGTVEPPCMDVRVKWEREHGVEG